jgi:hypothetical protein
VILNIYLKSKKKSNFISPWAILKKGLHSLFLPAQKCTICKEQILMLELSNKDSCTSFSTDPGVRMSPSSRRGRAD